MQRQGASLTKDVGDEPAGLQDNSADGGKKTGHMAAAIGGKLASAAERLRRALPPEGRLGGAAKAVSEKLESSGSYLQDQGLTGMRDD